MTKRVLLAMSVSVLLSACVTPPKTPEMPALAQREAGQGERVVVFTEGACIYAVGAANVVVAGSAVLSVAASAVMTVVFYPLWFVGLLPMVAAAAAATATVEGLCYPGELVAVEDTALVVVREVSSAAKVRSAEEDTAAPEPRLYRIAIAEVARVVVPVYEVPFDVRSEENRARLRTYAGYPGGLNPEQRRELLARYGQTDFLKVGNDAPSDDKPQ